MGALSAAVLGALPAGAVRASGRASRGMRGHAGLGATGATGAPTLPGREGRAGLPKKCDEFTFNFVCLITWRRCERFQRACGATPEARMFDMWHGSLLKCGAQQDYSKSQKRHGKVHYVWVKRTPEGLLATSERGATHPAGGAWVEWGDHQVAAHAALRNSYHTCSWNQVSRLASAHTAIACTTSVFLTPSWCMQGVCLLPGDGVCTEGWWGHQGGSVAHFQHPKLPHTCSQGATIVSSPQSAAERDWGQATTWTAAPQGAGACGACMRPCRSNLSAAAGLFPLTGSLIHCVCLAHYMHMLHIAALSAHAQRSRRPQAST